MSDPVRGAWLGVPGWLWLWGFTAASLALFAARMARYLKVLAAARSERRWDQWPRRLRLFVVNVFGQRRLLDEPLIGTAHLIIFWAFLIYATTFGWALLRGLFPFLPVPYPDGVAWIRAALEVFALIGLAALAVAVLRRYVFPPPALERSRDATLILILIAAVLISSLVGIRTASEVVRTRAWWTHMAVVLGFLAYLPYSKHMHLLASPFGVFFGSLNPGWMPAPSDGASQREQFTWRQLFNGLACAECGRCDRACPSVTSGMPLSPKALIRQIRDLVREAAPAAGLVPARVTPAQIWACATCAACSQVCPVFNEHLPVIIEARRMLVARGEIEARLQETLTNFARYGNSFGTSPRSRAKWTQSLEFRIKDARKEPIEYLWFVGDYASFDPRLQAATRAAARLFQRAGLDFGILYDAEQNSGNDARRIGEEGLFEMLREKNLTAFGKAAFKKIVTADPHAYHALKNEYFNGQRPPVLHSSELLADLLGQGRLPLNPGPETTATYHDPCYLGRYNNIYRPPRSVIETLGLRLSEMPRSGPRSFCCGAGGGRIWMEDAPGLAQRPAEIRVREAAQTGASLLVVACPKDLVMFQDAVKTAGLEDRLAVRDLAELVEERLRPEGSA